MLGCFVAAVHCCNPLQESVLFDYQGATSVSSTVLSGLTCVIDTQIDFNFPQSSYGSTSATSNTISSTYRDFSFSNSGLSMQFLDRNGLNQTYSLIRLTLSSPTAGARINLVNFPYPMTSLTELSLTFQDAAGD
jgi:hypothetical protein